MDYLKLKDIHNNLNDACCDAIRTTIWSNPKLVEQIIYSDGSSTPLPTAFDTVLQRTIQEVMPEIERVIDQNAEIEYQKGFDDAFEYSFRNIEEAEENGYERGFEAGIDYRNEELRGEGTCG